MVDWLERTKYWTTKFGKAAFDFGFPCASALYNLPADASMWKRGALAFGAVAEAALMVAPPLKGVVSLGARAIFQIGKSAMARASERQMLLTTEKTIAAAEGKIVQGSTGKIGEQIVTKEAVTNVLLKTDDVIHITPQGVAIPSGSKYQIPSHYFENINRPGSYGVYVNGKFVEKLRIDPATPPGIKGPSYSHYHRNSQPTHYSPYPEPTDPGFAP